jgi:hypothetical protein
VSFRYACWFLSAKLLVVGALRVGWEGFVRLPSGWLMVKHSPDLTFTSRRNFIINFLSGTGHINVIAKQATVSWRPVVALRVRFMVPVVSAQNSLLVRCVASAQRNNYGMVRGSSIMPIWLR